MAPTVDWNDRLSAARSEEFAELFHEAITDYGTVARLRQTLETASEWSRAHGAARSSASELDALADRLTDLGDELHLSGEDVGHEIRSRSHRAAAATRTPKPFRSWALPSSSRLRRLPTTPHPTVRSPPRSR